MPTEIINDTPLAVKDNIHLDPNKLLGYNKIDTA